MPGILYPSGTSDVDMTTIKAKVRMLKSRANQNRLIILGTSSQKLERSTSCTRSVRECVRAGVSPTNLLCSSPNHIVRKHVCKDRGSQMYTQTAKEEEAKEVPVRFYLENELKKERRTRRAPIYSFQRRRKLSRAYPSDTRAQCSRRCLHQ